MEKCPQCGAPIEDVKCAYCGYKVKIPQAASAQPQASVQPMVVNHYYMASQQEAANPAVRTEYLTVRKKKTVAFWLCFFLGYFGAHYFYIGRAGMGILYFFTMGLFGFGWLIDLVRIATGSLTDKNGRTLAK